GQGGGTRKDPRVHAPSPPLPRKRGREQTGFAARAIPSHAIAALEPHAALDDAAVRENGGGGEIAGAGAGQETDDARDLLRARHAPERYGGVELRGLGGGGYCAGFCQGRHRGRANADDEGVVLGVVATRRA